MKINKTNHHEILIFLSYSHKDKQIMGKLKSLLEKIGYQVFLAHEDINPSKEWQKEIIKNLRKCDVFIPFLNQNFKESDWTDQETGFAFSNNKYIIPLIADYTPYGFINIFQGLKFDFENINLMASEIHKTILEKIWNNKLKGSSMC